MELTGRSILVTGASGFIGGHLAQRLAAEGGVRVRALVRRTSRIEHLQDEDLELCYGDLTDLASLRQAMAGVDVVFHCAALAKEWGKAEEFYQANVQGTGNMLTAAAEVGVARFVHTSSVGVYGFEPADGTDETFPCQRSGNLYCDSKIDAEELALQYYHEKGLPVTVVRVAEAYGPRSFTSTVGPVLAIRMGWMELIDGGQGICNHLYVDNLVDAYLLAVAHDGAIGQIYLISDGVGTTWKEFHGYYAAMVGKDSLPSVSKAEALRKAAEMEARAEATGRPPMVNRAAVALVTRGATFKIDKARRELGYVPQVDLEEGMQRTEAWLRAKGYL